MFHIIGILPYVVCRTYLASFTQHLSSFTHVVVCTDFVLFYGGILSHRMTTLPVIYPFIRPWAFGSFQSLGYWIGVAMNKKMSICLNTCFRLNLFAKVRFSNLTGRSVCESPLSMSPFQFRQSSPCCICHSKSLELKHPFLVFHLPRVWPLCRKKKKKRHPPLLVSIQILTVEFLPRKASGE